MKKIILSIAFIATGLVASAQVGVGTTNPLVSLQVDRSTDNAQADGVLVPRSTVAQLNAKEAAYGTNQNGTLVYITAIAGAANQTSNVTATGFHYYDFPTNKWVSMVPKAPTVPARLTNTGGDLTNADLNGYVIYTGGTDGVTFSLGTITSPKVGDTITIADDGDGSFLVSGMAAPARSAPASNGGSVTYVYVNGGWYHTNSF